MADDADPVRIPIDGALDLHPFQPRDVKAVVLEYLDECQSRGLRRVRIIHGKGIGNLRRTVHSVLQNHPAVGDFHLATSGAGGWGATIVHLKSFPDSTP
ncbi:MAG: hypothetical protein RLY20_2218 [Verrucomicrobiota bacterium]|jgi:DNA-nicking Smr family endonuclease